MNIVTVVWLFDSLYLARSSTNDAAACLTLKKGDPSNLIMLGMAAARAS